MTNVIGNGVATAVVAMWEGELGEPVGEDTELLQTAVAG
jgi:Na+/H+-dicarboxylate symporter